MSPFFCQINKEVLYPLEIGNYWEYTNYVNVHYYEKVVEEVEMSNRKIYKKILHVDLIEEDSIFYFQRTENNLRMYSYVNGSEYKEYDFGLPIGSLWESYGIYKKIANRHDSFLSIIQDTVLVDDMIYVVIDSIISPPDTSVIIDLYDSFAKGVGLISAGWPSYYLTGLIINDIKYGEVTVGIYEHAEYRNNNLTLQVYPNPFNASTEIRYEISDSKSGSHNIQLSAYNSLGQEVAVLVNKAQKPGSYEVIFDGENLPSGTYFIQLTTGEYKKTIKALLME